MNYDIVFIGTSEFGEEALDMIIKDKQCNVKVILTQPDKKVGRKQLLTPSPIKCLAENRGIPVFQPENINSSEVKEQIRELNPDYIVVIAYGQILDEELLGIAKIAPVNVHASLLPKYRGASPIQNAILAGDQVTGVTVQKMRKELDAGEILSQKTCVIDPHDTFETLQYKLAAISAPLLRHTLVSPLHIEEQDEDRVSFCKKINKEDGKIEWEIMDASKIERLIRALKPWPGTYTFFGDKRMKILDAVVSHHAEVPSSRPGEVIKLTHSNKIAVACQKNFLILKKIQMEGKKEMEMDVFIKGSPDFLGTILK